MPAWTCDEGFPKTITGGTDIRRDFNLGSGVRGDNAPPTADSVRQPSHALLRRRAKSFSVAS